MIEAVEAVGMFIWLRVRLTDGTQERRFYKPGLDRLLAPDSAEPALAVGRLMRPAEVAVDAGGVVLALDPPSVIEDEARDPADRIVDAVDLGPRRLERVLHHVQPEVAAKGATGVVVPGAEDHLDAVPRAVEADDADEAGVGVAGVADLQVVRGVLLAAHPRVAAERALAGEGQLDRRGDDVGVGGAAAGV